MDLSDFPIVGRLCGKDNNAPQNDRIRPYQRLSEEVTPVRTDDPDVLRAAVKEARSSLDKRIEAIEEKDNMAISTVRLNFLLIGLSFTIASVVPSSLWYLNWLTIIGYLSLFCSTFIGIRAYMYTDYTPGVKAFHLEEISSAEYTNVEWLQWMNQEYTSWIRTVKKSERIEATRIGRTHLFQFVAVGLLLIGAIAGFYGMEPASIAPDHLPTENSTADSSQTTPKINNTKLNKTTDGILLQNSSNSSTPESFASHCTIQCIP
ncbi:hypothetical protein [Haloferax sp. Atlit-4N]|uniref:hypothetical protein n=1 Tax=Haloferax sp. Atlit-4N TaxID=2077206 RepID=UPI0011C06578|nr:hypothetical protein [Haloferax sp. Atlit-4N]